jgi:hypothetical protein
MEDRRSLPERSDELAVGHEFEQRMVAAVQDEDVPLRVERHANRFGHPDGVGNLEEIVDDVELELWRSRAGVLRAERHAEQAQHEQGELSHRPRSSRHGGTTDYRCGGEGVKGARMT